MKYLSFKHAYIAMGFILVVGLLVAGIIALFTNPPQATELLTGAFAVAFTWAFFGAMAWLT